VPEIAAGFVLYARERRRCDALCCRMAGSRVTAAVTVDQLIDVVNRSGSRASLKRHCQDLWIE